MRHSALLLTGLVLLGGGVAVLASDLTGRFLIGIPLIVIGILVKITGFVISDDPVRDRPGVRSATTLDGQRVESPRPGVPTGRAALAPARPMRARRASARRAAAMPPPIAPPTRRAG